MVFSPHEAGSFTIFLRSKFRIDHVCVHVVADHVLIVCVIEFIFAVATIIHAVVDPIVWDGCAVFTDELILAHVIVFEHHDDTKSSGSIVLIHEPKFFFHERHLIVASWAVLFIVEDIIERNDCTIRARESIHVIAVGIVFRFIRTVCTVFKTVVDIVKRDGVRRISTLKLVSKGS